LRRVRSLAAIELAAANGGPIVALRRPGQLSAGHSAPRHYQGSNIPNACSQARMVLTRWNSRGPWQWDGVSETLPPLKMMTARLEYYL